MPELYFLWGMTIGLSIAIKRFSLAAWLLLGFFRPMHAQDYTQTIRGTVTDADAKSPLEGATVLLIQNQPLTGTYTDEQGRFRLEKISPGRYTLQITYLGYETATIPNVVVNTGKEVVLQLSLTEKVIQAAAVEIIAGSKQEARNEMTTVSTRQFSIEETQRYAGSWNDPARMARNFAGVSTGDDARNDVIIRGNSPSGVLWRLDGVDIANPNHFSSFGTTGGPVSILNNNLLDNSDFMTGAFPAEYGNALAGVFDLRLRKGNDEEYEFLAQIGVNGLEFMAEGPISRKTGASFLINYRYSTLELMKDLGIDFGTSSQPSFQDASFKVVFPSPKMGDISIFGIGGRSNALILDSERDTSDFFGPAGNDIDIGSNTGALGVQHRIFVGKKTFVRNTISATGGTQLRIVDAVDQETKQITPFYRNNSFQGKLNHSLLINSKLSVRHTIRAGWYLDQQHFNLEESLQIDPDLGFVTLADFNGQSWLIQPFAQWKWRINEQWTLNAGIHYQHFTFNGSSALEPRLGLRWSPVDRHAFGFAYGEHSQLQPVYVYFIQDLQPDSTYLMTNRDLDFTRNRHFVFSYDWGLGKDMRFKAEAYYQQLRNVPIAGNEANSFSLLNEGADYVVQLRDSLINEGTGRNYGFEVTAEKFFGNGYYFLLTGALFQSKYTGSDGIERNTAFSNNYTATLLGGYEKAVGKKKRVRLGFDGRVATAGGRRYTPIDPVASATSVFAVYREDLAFGERLKPYFRADIRTKVRVNSRKVSQEVAIDISNIFNTTNPLNIIYDQTTNTLRTNYQLGFFPVAQYRVEF
ncbi:MAG: TonB-dependent receptor [Bacteroidota bacterium]